MAFVHRHDHSHPHTRGGRSFGPAFAAGTLLNVALVAIQVAYGFAANSVALLADAGHNLGDVAGLLLAWAAYGLSRWRPSERFTYGFRSASLIAPLLNAVILLIATGAILWEAMKRFGEPPAVAGVTVMVVAALAVILNGVAAWLLAAGSKGDLNIRGAFLHMVADAGVSLGVVIAGGLIVLTGRAWIDPAVSLLISAVIIWSTWGLLRESVGLSMHGVPAAIELPQVRSYLELLPGVASVHDLHIWPMSSTETALTCHLVMPEGAPGDKFLVDLSEELHRQFAIEHPTVQIERGDESCPLKPDQVV